VRGSSYSPSPQRAASPPPRNATPPRDGAATIEDLASWISTKYMGMGKTAMDALPELRRQVMGKPVVVCVAVLTAARK